MKRNPGKRVLGRENSKCKGPEGGSGLVHQEKERRSVWLESSITFFKTPQRIWNMVMTWDARLRGWHRLNQGLSDARACVPKNTPDHSHVGAQAPTHPAHRRYARREFLVTLSKDESGESHRGLLEV